GDLLVTARGVIDQALNAGMSVGGNVSLNANSGRDAIILDEVNNSFGSITVEGSDVSITEVDASTDFDFADVESLTLIAAGDVNATGQMIVESDLDILAANGSGDVTLDNPGNELNRLTVEADDVVIVNNEATRLTEIDAGSLTLTSTGNVTDGEDELEVAGLASISTDGNITLGTNNPVQFGSLAVSGINVNITQTGDINLDTSSVTGTLDLASTEENIFGIAGADIEVDNDTALVTGENAAIDFGESINRFGDLTLVTGSAVVAETDDVSIEFIDADSLVLESAANITDITAAEISILNDATFIAGDNILLGDGESDQFNAGNIDLTAINATITESSGTQIEGINLDGSLTLTSGGDVTDRENALLNVIGSVTIDADGGIADIVLNNSQNEFGSVDFTGSTVQLNETQS
ncbi:MAG: hypothetical protein WD356_00150, partial [Pseudomonadales bacterium]